MALTKVGTDGIKDDAVTIAKQAAGTDGQIITYDANGHPVAVGPGSDGQVLTSTGAGSPPAFEDVPAGGISDIVSDTSPQLGGNLDVNTKNIEFGDSSGASDDRLTFGDGTDLKIYHDGTNSYVENDNANGALILTSAQDVEISAADDWTIHGVANAQVELYHDGTKKFETNANGVSIYGNVGFVSAGQGIDFGATANGTTMASELFDDYEEGAWDPIARNGIASAAYTVQDGYYTKVGTLVHCTFTIQWGSGCTTNGGHIMLGNAPFTVASSPHDDKGMGLITYQNMESTGYGLYIHMSGARLDLYVGSTNAWTIANATDMNGKWIKGGFTYRAA